MSDPVASQSRFLCMYMSNHPDTLVSYVKYFGKVQENVVSAKLDSIDTKGMNLSYKTKAGNKTVRVEFDPPLLGYEEVKPRLIGMKAEADEALGTSKTPAITSFRLPRSSIGVIIPLGLLIYTTITPDNDPSPVWAVGQFLRSTVGLKVVYGSWIFAAVVHSLETLYAASLARKHQMPFSVAAAYLSAVFLIGFPVLGDLRKRIQQARIDSIMKGQ